MTGMLLAGIPVLYKESGLIPTQSTEQMVETRLLRLVGLSLLLHLLAFALWFWWPASQPRMVEPTFIDLQDSQLPTDLPARKAIPSDKTRRVSRQQEVRKSPQARAIPAPAASRQPVSRSSSKSGLPGKPSLSTTPPAAESSIAGLLRKTPSQQATSGNGHQGKPNLMPSASKLARVEEQYRRRYADDIDDGSTRFLNTDDIQFGSFLRHFETAVYGVWRYPQEALQKGIEGMTPVKITFNRKGEIVGVRLLESSGSKILDDEVLRTLRAIGPVGRLPNNYRKDEFSLIAFFYYGNARGRLR